MPDQNPVSLPEYAQGLSQLNTEVQRQTDAYGHFRSIVTAIDEMAADPAKQRPRLPFIIVRAANSQGPDPHDLKVDLNAIEPEDFSVLRPLFDYLMRNAGVSMMAAWESIINISGRVHPVVAAARQRQQAPASVPAIPAAPAAPPANPMEPLAHGAAADVQVQLVAHPAQ